MWTKEARTDFAAAASAALRLCLRPEFAAAARPLADVIRQGGYDCGSDPAVAELARAGQSAAELAQRDRKRPVYVTSDGHVLQGVRFGGERALYGMRAVETARTVVRAEDGAEALSLSPFKD